MKKKVLFPASVIHAFNMRALTLIIFTGFSSAITQLKAQDNPFIRLKQAAEAAPVEKTDLPKKTISTADPTWKQVSKSPVLFRPFPMKNREGRLLQPTEIITLPNGKKVQAKKYFDQVNELEKNLNTAGYSLRTDDKVIVSKIVTPPQELDGKVGSAPSPVSTFRSAADREAFMKPVKKVGQVILKPMDEYTGPEKIAIEKVAFKSVGESDIETITPESAGRLPAASTAANVPLKVINETITKEWSFGSANTFKAGVRGSLSTNAKIYRFDPLNAANSQSEFKVAADATVYGSIFNHSLNILSGNAEVFAPANLSRNLTAKVVIKVGNTTVFNLNESYTQSKSFNGNKARSIDESFAISVPTLGPIRFSGRVGIRGNAGMEYSANLYRTFAQLKATPLVELNGYAEAGLDLYAIEFGVGGNLRFIKGELELQSYAGIWTQTASRVVAAYCHYFGYDLEMLKGNLYGYIKIWMPWPIDDRHYETEFFNWSGYKRSGTISEGCKSYVFNTGLVSTTASNP